MKTLTLWLVLLAGTALAQVEIDYWLWDANQQAAYEECATVFQEQNPDISINITQQGWGDYWTTVTTGFVAGTAPDVFTNHLAKYPEFAANGQIVDIAPLIAEDSVATDIYLDGLLELWGRDDAQYGLPKDWDTVSIIYNKEMLDAAGIDPSELEDLSWNPNDGGSFQNLVARLTLDENGNNGLSADFDPSNVVQFGYIPFAYNDSGQAYGQTQWSHFAVSNGWQFNDGLYAESYFYDDPKFVETIDWLANLVLTSGFTPKLPEIKSLGGNALFTAGQGALILDGSWQIRFYDESAPFDVGFAPLPAGPEGRKSMFNGLADSIWEGSDKQAEAWEWVKFLASDSCQNIVGSYAVVFPAIPSAVDASLAAHEDAGRNVSSFTLLAQTEGSTFLFPITDFASEITSIMDAAMDSIFLGEVDAETALATANQDVNALFE